MTAFEYRGRHVKPEAEIEAVNEELVDYEPELADVPTFEILAPFYLIPRT